MVLNSKKDARNKRGVFLDRLTGDSL